MAVRKKTTQKKAEKKIIPDDAAGSTEKKLNVVGLDIADAAAERTDFYKPGPREILEMAGFRLDASEARDNWNNRSMNMTCSTCMHFKNFRCKRHAPTMQGYPAVYLDDSCGDHKIDKQTMLTLNAVRVAPHL